MRVRRAGRTGGIPAGRWQRRAIVVLASLAIAVATRGRPVLAGDCTTTRIAGVRPFPCPAPAGAQYPRLGPGPHAGSLLLSWLEAGSRGRHSLRFSVYRSGEWSAARTIVTGDSLFVNWADFPVVESVGPDMLVAAWLQRVGGEPFAYHVRASVGSADGSRWSAPVTVHSDRSATEHGFVSIASEASDARLVWLDGHKFAGREPDAMGAEMTLHTALLGRDGVVRDERELDGRTCDCCNTAMTWSSGGTFIAYRDRDSAEVRDLAFVHLPRDGPPVRGLLHADGWTIPGCPVNGPALDIGSPSDGIGAAWYTETGDRPRVFFAVERLDGETISFGPPATISEGRPLGRVGVAAVGQCEFVVSWLEARGKSADVMVRIARRDGTLGEPVRVATTSAKRASGFPQVQMTHSGGRDLTVVAWTEPGKQPRVRLATITLLPVE